MQKFENITESVRFPAYSLLKSEINAELKSLVFKVRSQRQTVEALKTSGAETAEHEKNLASFAEELSQGTPESFHKEMEFYGIGSLADDIDVKMKLGSLLFDLYIHMSPEPASPLGKLVWKKKLMELAEMLDKPEGVVPEWACEPVTRALSDDSIWSKTQLTAWVEVPGPEGATEPLKRFFPINPNGAAFFQKVLTAAAEALYNPSVHK